MSILRPVPIAALTTVFTHSCSETWLLTTTRAPSQFPPFPTAGPASCELPNWKDNIAAHGIRYYSPAICPSGFFIGPNCGVTKTRTNEGFPPVTAGETVAYCVPSDFTCTTDTTDFRGGVWGFATATAPEAQVTVAPAIQIRWRDSDLSILQTHPLTPGLLLVGDRTSSTSTGPPEASPTGNTSMRFSTIVPVPSTTTRSPAASTPTTTTPLSAPSTQLPSATSEFMSSSDPFATRSPDGLRNSPFDPPNGTPSTQQARRTAIGIGATFTTLAFAALLLFALNRYCRKRRLRNHPKKETEKEYLTPIGVGVWARCGQKTRSWGVMLRLKSTRRQQRVYDKQRDDPEEAGGWGGAGGARGPVMETIMEVDGRPRLGTRGNPAELEAASRRNTQRWSWMSRLSDVVGGRRSNRTTIGSRPGTSSIFGGRTSADWEAFTKERWPNGLTVPPQTYQGGGGGEGWNTRSNSHNKRSSGMIRSLSKGPSPTPSASRREALSQLQWNLQQPGGGGAASSSNAHKGHMRNKSSQFRLSERSDGTFGEMPRSPPPPRSPGPRSPGFGFLPSPTSSPVSVRDHLSSRSSS
ncbi:hypothetical protein PG996_000458 [Apiospora saccharicola]|uniref:Uncharacterized protein n=1 Tax=Apiospora saccharicola TaxID=335842 RepID=A0ABR1WDT5_9PEZI